MQNRFAHVDAMRGIAVLLVVWLHTTEVFVGIETAYPKSGIWLFDLAWIVDFGRIGVVLFFFISGFVIPASLAGDTNAASFIQRRFFRLYPAYWVSILLGVVVTWWALDRPIQAWEVAANFTMIQEAFGAPDVLALYWTLRMELLFYALCLLLFLIRALHRDVVLVGIAGIALSAFVLINAIPLVFRFLEVPDMLKQWNAHFAFLSIMFTGALWRRHFGGEVTIIGRAFLAAATGFWVIIFPLVGAVLIARSGEINADHTRLFFSYPLATLLFLLGLKYFRVTWRPLVFVGEISYSLYLLHPIVIYGLVFMVSHLPGLGVVSQNLGISLAIVAAVSIGISAVSYRFVEVPMVSFGKRVSGGRRPAPAL